MKLHVAALTQKDEALLARYDAFFESCPNAFIQQSTDWARVIAPLGPDHPYFLLCEDEMGPVGGLPLYHFIGPAGGVLTSVPQAGPLGGVFLRPGQEGNEAVFKALFNEATNLADRLDCSILTMITNFLTNDAGIYERCLPAGLVFENFTQWILLSDCVKDGHLNISGTVGNNVRASHRKGVRVRRAARGDFDVWHAIHRRRHRELGISPLPENLLVGLLSGLEGKGKAWLEVAEFEGEIISGCVCVRHRNICDAFIMSMDSRFAHLDPNYALTAHILENLSLAGGAIFNWQSSAARSNGVYNFKKGWRAREAAYSIVSKLLKPIDPFLALGREGLAKGYAGHYALPFGLFDAPACRRFAKP
ncbi:MAG: GNAT family N-acetyltransferase [Rhodospirillales bacterium]|nr:GNAT family N-acetyltransferase [Rhodospirillales bacterium]